MVIVPPVGPHPRSPRRNLHGEETSQIRGCGLAHPSARRDWVKRTWSGRRESTPRPQLASSRRRLDYRDDRRLVNNSAKGPRPPSENPSSLRVARATGTRGIEVAHGRRWDPSFRGMISDSVIASEWIDAAVRTSDFWRRGTQDLVLHPRSTVFVRSGRTISREEI